MIDLENVKKSYATGVQALNGISLHIDRGEFVFIVGDNNGVQGFGGHREIDPFSVWKKGGGTTERGIRRNGQKAIGHSSLV